MACLLINYDLNTPGQDYAALHKEIEALGSGWWHYLDSTWLVLTALTPHAAAERLRQTLDDSDSLLVLDITGDAFAGWLEADAWDWIDKNV
jgi:hypothetical protein